MNSIIKFLHDSGDIQAVCCFKALYPMYTNNIIVYNDWCPLPLLDGHNKLIRWRFVTHCSIDGYSRLVVFIKCSTNNKAATVYDLFLQAVHRYGLPSRTRCDQGGENILVAQHMLCHHGSERRSVLVGSSVHNQRIERLRRDVLQ